MKKTYFRNFIIVWSKLRVSLLYYIIKNESDLRLVGVMRLSMRHIFNTGKFYKKIIYNDVNNNDRYHIWCYSNCLLTFYFLCSAFRKLFNFCEFFQIRLTILGFLFCKSTSLIKVKVDVNAHDLNFESRVANSSRKIR